MPTAREALLDAALSALGHRSWHGVRMVEVALSAGLSRQTLYNEFGSKDGLGRALVEREVGTVTAGVEQAFRTAARAGADAGDCVAAAAVWTLDQVEHNPLVRPVLIGGLDGPLDDITADIRPSPTEVVSLLNDQAVSTLGPSHPSVDPDRMAAACEAGIRLILSYVIAPVESADEAVRSVADLVRSHLGPSTS